MVLDRSAILAALPRTAFRTTVAAAGLAMSILAIGASAALSQSASPPASPPARPIAPQAVPDQPAPQAPVAREENPGLLNEMGKIFEKSLSILPPLKSPTEAIDDLNARAKDAAKDAGEGLSRLAKPSSMVTGRKLQERRRQALPKQGIQGRQEPECRFDGSLFCQSADSRSDTKTGRLPDRLLRHARAVPVARKAPLVLQPQGDQLRRFRRRSLFLMSLKNRSMICRRKSSSSMRAAMNRHWMSSSEARGFSFTMRCHNCSGVSSTIFWPK